MVAVTENPSTLTASTSVQENVYSYLLAHAVPEAIAVIAGDQATTYEELIEQADVIAATITRAGVRHGDRVAISADNSVFWIASYLAILKLGAVAVPLPQRLGKEKVAAMLTTVGAKIACVDTRSLNGYAALSLPDFTVITPQQPRIAISPQVLLTTEGAKNPTSPVIDQSDLAALMFTSGTTGQPNAVKVSHRNIAANTESILQYLQLTSADRMMVILPFSYCFGTSLLHTHLRAGASLVLHNSFVFLEDVLNKMDELQCTGFAGVPATYQRLLRRSSFATRRFPHLRLIQQAGGRLHDTYIKEIRASQPDIRLFVMYGQTEATARLSYMPPEHLDEKLGSIGRGLEGVTLHVLDTQGNPVSRNGELGEVVAEGDNITLGYWVPDPNKAPFRNGKLYTGDMARIDEDGFIFIADRLSDFIKPNGHRVSSREVEEVLAQIPEVVEVAVVGMPHPEFGEAIRAFVVTRTKAELSEKEILDFCRKQLPIYMVPSEIVFMSELPKNDSQKVLKKELKVYQAPTPQ